MSINLLKALDGEDWKEQDGCSSCTNCPKSKRQQDQSKEVIVRIVSNAVFGFFAFVGGLIIVFFMVNGSREKSRLDYKLDSMKIVKGIPTELPDERVRQSFVLDSILIAKGLRNHR
ncbi:hypothetical protein SAMN05421780_104283 [Flexibacter flexilis DSM 6793]|uniref:Uncharacterized protein n=1 Tax=Flexibacter flexilis DSM 6793 TaxID=927664 RepID=A0A1I1IA19_9BACT|nr:hypothetical protein [Flexibacter flexilis]SFC33086.1 hypothetical protein SAMN05421780_104283 [Flexibacter flexilis DSM 6793]